MIIVTEIIIKTADNFNQSNFYWYLCLAFSPPILTYNRRCVLLSRRTQSRPSAFVGSLFPLFSPLSLPAAPFAESSNPALCLCVSVVTIPGRVRWSRACFSLRGRVYRHNCTVRGRFCSRGIVPDNCNNLHNIEMKLCALCVNFYKFISM